MQKYQLSRIIDIALHCRSFCNTVSSKHILMLQRTTRNKLQLYIQIFNKNLTDFTSKNVVWQSKMQSIHTTKKISEFTLSNMTKNTKARLTGSVQRDSHHSSCTRAFKCIKIALIGSSNLLLVCLFTRDITCFIPK